VALLHQPGAGIMKPLNLREYAEALALGPDREFATEILENLDFVETSEYEELCDDLQHISEKEFKEHSPRKQVDRLGDRLNVLDIIQDIFDKAGLKGDPDDVARDLVEDKLALRSLLKLDATGDIFEAVAQLVDNQAKEYDL
jgi:hypothetical protein